jgi:hypothetical protein
MHRRLNARREERTAILLQLLQAQKENEERNQEMPIVKKCKCGNSPWFVEGAPVSTESVLLTGGMPSYYRIECRNCGYKTKNHDAPSGAIDEWNAHAEEVGK